MFELSGWSKAYLFWVLRKFEADSISKFLQVIPLISLPAWRGRWRDAPLRDAMLSPDWWPSTSLYKQGQKIEKLILTCSYLIALFSSSQIMIIFIRTISLPQSFSHSAPENKFTLPGRNIGGVQTGQLLPISICSHSLTSGKFYQRQFSFGKCFFLGCRAGRRRNPAEHGGKFALFQSALFEAG